MKWPLLQQAIRSIYSSNRASCSHEELYRATEEICSDKLGEELYKNIEREVESHVRELGGILRKMTSVLTNETFLPQLNAVWKRHCEDTQLIRQVVLFLDRTYALTSGVRSIWDMGLYWFGKLVVEAPEVMRKMLDGLLQVIENERRGDSVDQYMLHSLLRMTFALGVYTPVFEPEFLKATQTYYAAQAQENFTQWEVSTFLKWVQARLNEEALRVGHYMHESTKRPLLTVTEQVLLSCERLENVIEKGFNQLMEESRFEDLALLYALFQRVGQLKMLDVAFSSYVKQVGVEIVAEKERDKTMVQDMLDFKAKCTNIIQQAFHSNGEFFECEKRAFEHFVNVRANKPAELIAKYIDTQLKSSKLSEEQIDELLTRVMVLFRYINGKDVFEAFYKKDLAKRLLLGRSVSLDWEKMMISKLKAECGSMFTTKLEGMFKDLDTSSSLLTEFLGRKGAECPVQLQLHVLTAVYWPPYAAVRVTLPPELTKASALFEQFYSNKYEARRLTWQHALSYVQLGAQYPKNVKKQFHVSLFQAVVLLQFNDSEELSLVEMEQRTGLEKDELNRTLKSLCMGKVKVVLRVRKGESVAETIPIQDEDSFRWNGAFKHKMMRIKINTIQVQETVEESEQVREAVMRDRQYQIDAAIVRIMKMRRSLPHSLLVAELYNQLKFPIKPADIKKRIESLIDREYLERDENQQSVFKYIA